MGMGDYHGDEDECHGHCGLCDECESRKDAKGEEQYEQWRDEQLFD